MSHRSWQCALAFAAVLTTSATGRGGDTAAAPDYAQLRAARAASLTRPDGWFSLVALEWLREGDTTVGSAPGNTLVLQHVPAHLLTLHKAGAAVTLAYANAALQQKESGSAAKAGSVVSANEDDAHALACGDVLMWVIERGGQRYLRVKDPQAPERVHFHGLKWYAPQPQYRVLAKWVPYDTPHTLAITNKLGQVTQEPVAGYAAFTLDGKPETLEPTIEGDSLFFVFRDTTSRLATDGGGRFLSTAMPSQGLRKPGTVQLDFNQAVNPPCAYSPYATCPLAPARNRLAIAVPAGEKRYED